MRKSMFSNGLIVVPSIVSPTPKAILSYRSLTFLRIRNVIHDGSRTAEDDKLPEHNGAAMFITFWKLAHAGASWRIQSTNAHIDQIQYVRLLEDPKIFDLKSDPLSLSG